MGSTEATEVLLLLHVPQVRPEVLLSVNELPWQTAVFPVIVPGALHNTVMITRPLPALKPWL
jgi:hypothetical protein